MGSASTSQSGNLKSGKPRPSDVPQGAWTITFMLFLFMLVNFADKIIVGLAGKPIMDEMKLSPQQFGQLGSAFFWLFSISAIAVGFLVNTIATRWVILVLALIWALTQFPMWGEVTFTTMLVCRVLLGAGEGPAYAVACHALYKWFPDEKRALPTAILSQGSAMGVVVAVPALNFLIINYSWHAAFLALGVVGVMWVLAWLVLGQEGPLTDAGKTDDENTQHVPYLKLLTTPTFIGSVLASFGAYWTLVLGLTWYVPYMRALEFDQKTAGDLSILPWLMGAAVVLLAGWTSQTMTLRGTNTRTSRGVLGAAPLVVAGIMLYGTTYVTDPLTQVLLIAIASGLCAAIYPLCPPMLGEFSPSAQRGAIIAIYGALYTSSGILAPLVMGSMIDKQNPLPGYLAGFRIQALILIASGLIGLLLLWPNAERARLKQASIAQ